MNASGNRKPRVAAIVLAAGSGSRMGSDITKQKINVLGETVLHRSVRAFCECEAIDSVTVVTREDELDFVSDELSGIHPKYRGAVVGGASRAESAAIGFESVESFADYVAIHDAARCLVTPMMIELVAKAAIKCGAATAATRITDTVKRSDGQGRIAETVPRELLWSAQTPQIISTEIYSRGLSLAKESVIPITDDNMIAELAGARVALVDCGRENIKITVASDIGYAEHILATREDLGGRK